MALESRTGDRPPDRRVSTQDDFALSDKDLAKWLARKAGLRPLVRSVPALHGFATAAIIGPPFADPQLWICPAMGFRWDVVARGSNKDYQVLATVSHIHNAIADALDAGIFAPAFTTKSGGSGVDPAPWCQGFYSAMQLHIYVGSSAGHIPATQRSQYSDCGIDACKDIRIGDTGLLRLTFWLAIQRHEATNTLSYEVIACSISIRSGLAKSSN